MTLMLSVIIVSDGAEHAAVATLSALVPGATAGLIREVLLVDRTGGDAIARVADIAGCAYVACRRSHAEALAAGAARARATWLMFMRAGAIPDPTWVDETVQFIQAVTTSGRPRAGIFPSARSPYAPRDWWHGVRSIARLIGMPSPDQGLLIARAHYDQLGGYSPRARRPEAQLLRQLGHSSRMLLRSRIVMA